MAFSNRNVLGEASQCATRRQFCSNVVATSIAATAPLPLAKASRAKPFVKWAGGKGQLIPQLEALFPVDLSSRDNLTYVEPFVGGGAMVFYVLGKYRNIRRVVINDINRDLIGTYSVIRDAPDALVEKLMKLQTEYQGCDTEAERKEYYLRRRADYNQHNMARVENAALFIFLNRTCFNGLYRVNSKGLYNVPFGRAMNPLICDRATLYADSELLQNVEIVCGDFEGVYDHIQGRAFVYFDPPYRPLPKTPSFTSYAKGGFDDEQQRRLAEFCRKLDKEGHQWLLSNSDPTNTDPEDKFFDNLYRGYDIQRISANRMINSKADGRGKITELAIRNYRR